ncbi:unnamed protein product, partial [Prorocentrum cordatum]
ARGWRTLRAGGLRAMPSEGGRRASPSAGTKTHETNDAGEDIVTIEPTESVYASLPVQGATASDVQV